jgi:predicted TIM-barrel fold metal-dependent hydrolase
MRKVSFVSVDGHAAMPASAWGQYVEGRYDEDLERLRRENEVFAHSMGVLQAVTLPAEIDPVFDPEGIFRGGAWQGLWDADIRIEEMDREGVASEIVYPGDPRVTDLGFNVLNGTYRTDFVDAGVRAFDRWNHDTFGPHGERFLLVGAAGTFTDMEASLTEARWIADHGFVGAFAPGFTVFEGMPALHDPALDPLWALYAEAGVAVVIHAGYGFAQGMAYEQIELANAEVAEKGGGDPELVTALATRLFNSGFATDLKARRAMSQMMFGGVFDRHPNLKLMMVEVRADWLPATLRHLDGLYERHRADLPAVRRPSDYWASNCLAGLSFMHRAEVEMRDEIGLETIAFGRDYPHTEGTWPNTPDFLRSLMAGVPEREVRLMLGDNLVRFLGLDGRALDAVAERVGPEIDDITGSSEIDDALLEHLSSRTGLRKPAEGDGRIEELSVLIDDVLTGFGATSGT